MTIYTHLEYLLVAIVLTLLASNCAQAQCVVKDATIVHARYQEGETKIYVALSTRINQNDLDNSGQPAQWRLTDLTALSEISLTGVAAEYLIAGETTSLILTLQAPLKITHDYRLQAPYLTFLGCSTKGDEHPDVIVKKKKSTTVPAQQEPEKNTYFPIEKAEDRKSSNVYLSGSFAGASGGKPDFTADIKIDIPRVLTTGGTRLREIDFRPYFELKTSTAENSDADAMSFGGKFRFNWNVANRGFLRYVLWEPALGFESDRRFKHINLISSQIVTLGIPGNKRTAKRRIRVLPFFGYEIGHNLKTPVAETKGRTISRGLAGATMYFALYRSEESAFSLQVDYVRRFLLNREISFEQDENKKLVPLFLGKGPRDYVKATAEYTFSKFTGFALSYEYGRLPPNFELVDHKYSIGLVMKFSTKFGNK